MTDEELMKLAFEEDKTVIDILRHIFNLGVEKGRADVIEEILKHKYCIYDDDGLGHIVVNVSNIE